MTKEEYAQALETLESLSELFLKLLIQIEFWIKEKEEIPREALEATQVFLNGYDDFYRDNDIDFKDRVSRSNLVKIVNGSTSLYTAQQAIREAVHHIEDQRIHLAHIAGVVAVKSIAQRFKSLSEELQGEDIIDLDFLDLDDLDDEGAA